MLEQRQRKVMGMRSWTNMSNKVIVVLILLLLNSCRNSFKNQYDIKSCEVKSFELNNRSVDLYKNQKLREDVKQTIMASKEIRGPIKGIKIFINFECPENGRIIIISFAGTKYFSYKNRFYKAAKNILPDSLRSSLLR